ncbi:MAG: glycosyl transferase family 2 [Bacteroidetes bacterium]|nr:MAG: glycosyl transferase family 2 [Bacteroidota bacterium]
MDLSIIIVNYNVRYFLEQCLHAVQQGIVKLNEEGYDAEISVVDNNSVDGSVAEVRQKFPGVKVIENRENVGFSKANNQAIAQSTGRYVLLLNPDTVVEEDTFLLCVDFMDSHPDAGAMGVKMIDGKGVYLPESKRALPTPEVSFYKMFGLASLFPRSKRFGKYYLGHLDKDSTHPVDVLAGAFMFLRKETLEKTGYLDESFFMYGEDIDLSYRITKAGYLNYYFPHSTIIHYKGESTKKGTLNYVKIFYQAMIIFAAKHFSSRKARVFSIVINIAIYFRAALSLVRRFVSRIYKPLLDGLIIFLGYLFGLPFWEQIRFDTVAYYPPHFLRVVVPAYILIWLLSLYYSGVYDKPMRFLSFLKGHLAGTLLILVIYALLPMEWRYSRALIFLGSLWALVGTLALRLVLHLAGVADYQIDLNRQKRMVIVGMDEEARRVSGLLRETQARPEIIGFVSPSSEIPYGEENPDYVGYIDQIDEIAAIHRLDEIVFCSKDLSSTRIIKIMTRLIGSSVDFKIAPPESLSVIGSNSINTSGDLYTIHFNSIGKESNRRNKRLFDVVSSFLLLITFPFWFLFVKGHFNSVGDTLWVLLGFRTWVGYLNAEHREQPTLPRIKKGILNPGSHLSTERLSPEKINEINVVYSKDYRPLNDLLIIARNFRKI